VRPEPAPVNRETWWAKWRREQKRDSYHRRKAKLAQRVCANPECESPFQPHRRDQVYCQGRCRDRAKYLKARGRS
jgi:hypothetical protein